MVRYLVGSKISCNIAVQTNLYETEGKVYSKS